MKNPLKPMSQPYEPVRQQLLERLADLEPTTDEYSKVLTELDRLDKILNRTSEFKKTVIPALGTIGSVAGIYALQQFAGVLVPKALQTLASRSSQKD